MRRGSGLPVLLRWIAAGVLSFAVASSSGCSGSERAAVCVPGVTQPCFCSDGTIGAQSCADDGHRWNACMCGPVTNPPVAESDGGTSTDGGTRDVVSPPRDASAPDVMRPDASAEAGLPGDATRGATVYARYCATCHGSDGRGTATGPDITEEVTEKSDHKLLELFAEGDDDMPPIPMTSQEAQDVIAYLRATYGPYVEEEEDD